MGRLITDVGIYDNMLWNLHEGEMMAGKETEKKVIPIKVGWFHIPTSPEDKPYLIGSRCEHCGFISFPKTTICRSCMRDDTMREVHIGRKGKLDTFTISMQGPPGFATPYIQAFVTLEEGIRVFTIIEGCEPEPDAMELGQELELVIGKIKTDEHGNDVIGWKFRPVNSKQKSG
jgi:uncharacterized OB-fold protein